MHLFQRTVSPDAAIDVVFVFDANRAMEVNRGICRCEKNLIVGKIWGLLGHTINDQVLAFAVLYLRKTIRSIQGCLLVFSGFQRGV